MKTFTHCWQIYLDDTDQLGIVYHTNHLRYFERSRTECLRENGLSLTTMIKDDTYFVIKNLQINYLAPIFLDDLIRIETQMKKQGHCQLLFQQYLYNQGQQLLSNLVVDVVCVNGKMKPKRLPKQMNEEFFS